MSAARCGRTPPRRPPRPGAVLPSKAPMIPGQHVAGSGGGRPRRARRVEVHRPAGIGDDGDVALEQDGGAEVVGQRAGGATRSSPGGWPARRSNSPARAVVPSARRGSDQLGMPGHGWSASASTITGGSVASIARSVADSACPVPNPGPITQACTRRRYPARAPPPPQASAETTWAAALPTYRTIPEWVATAAPVHNTAAPDNRRNRPARPSHPGCTCRPAAPAAPSSAATSVVSNPSTSVAGSSRPMSTRCTRPQSASACTGLSPPKVTVSTGRTAGPVIAPVSTSTPLGGRPRPSVHGRRRPLRTPRGGGAQRATTRDTDDAVDPEGGARCHPAPRARRPCGTPLGRRDGTDRSRSAASAAAPRRRRNVAAHSASPPLSPDPTTAQTRRPPPPVRRPPRRSGGDRDARGHAAARAHRRVARPAAVLPHHGSADRSSSAASAPSVEISCGRWTGTGWA